MRPIPTGHQAVFETVVSEAMTVDFEQPHPRLGRLHGVYATYWMAKHMELAGRMILLDFLEDGEEGIGSKVSVSHKASALVGMGVRVEATHTQTEGNRVYAAMQVWNQLGDLIGEGSTEQVVLPGAKLEGILERLHQRWKAATGGER